MSIPQTHDDPGEFARRCTYQAEIAEWVGAATINLHGGGAYGDKTAALGALRWNIDRLPTPVAITPTLENDDKVYTPSDLLPVCADTGAAAGLRRASSPLPARRPERGRDHRDTPRGHEQAEPLFHISSPLPGWDPDRKPERHHDYVEAERFPPWSGWVGRSRWMSRAKATKAGVIRPDR
ncbi:MAG: hypothetical protein IPM84_27855 [Anaerolineae bacterium]|nr:hypothetical protein [Anaerolineae bacterium]